MKTERPLAQTASILINTGDSSAIPLGAGARQLAGVVMPAAWTAASVTFAVSHDGVTYQQLHYGAGVYTITAQQGAAAGMSFSVDPAAFAGWPFVRIYSGTVATPVVQLAARTLVVVTRST